MPNRTPMRALVATVTAITSACLSISAANAQPSSDGSVPVAVNRVIPKPLTVTDKKAAPFIFQAGDCVSLTGSGAKYAADILRKDVFVPFGVALPVGDNCRVKISVNDATQPAEGYSLDVNSDSVSISAAGSPGAIWGVQTLAQLIGPTTASPLRLNTKAKVPAVAIADKPNYAYRGLLVDPARNFMPRDEIMSIIDHMSELKLNKLHMHLSDDQGWRLQIANPPKADNPDGIDYGDLTKYSGSTSFIANDSNFAPSAGKSGFYTEQDYEAIVTYAAEHGIQVIPEFDTPAHAGSVLHAIKQLNSKPKTVAFPWETWPRPDKATGRIEEPVYKVSTTLVPNDVTYRFVTTVFNTVLRYQKEAVPADSGITADRIHMGGDENSRLGDAGFTKFIKGLSDLKIAGSPTKTFWGEATKAATDVADGSTIQIWRKADNPLLPEFMAAHPNSKYIVSKANLTYYPQRPVSSVAGPAWACSEKDAEGKFCSAKAFYNWDPATYVAYHDDKVLGVEGAMWNEHVRSLHDWEFSVYPRLASTAEVAWTPRDSRDYASFASALPNLGQHLIFGGATFNIDPKIAPSMWTGGVYGVDQAVVDDGTLALVVYPGMTADDASKITATVTHDGQTTPVALKVTMDTPFHLSDPNLTMGRQMNSVAKITCVDPAVCSMKGATFTITASIASGNGAVKELNQTVSVTTPSDSSPTPPPKGPISGHLSSPISDGSSSSSMGSSTNALVLVLVPIVAAIFMSLRAPQIQALIAPFAAALNRN